MTSRVARNGAEAALVVDDEPAVRQFVGRAIARAWSGLAVVEAAGLAEAKEKLEDLRPRVVVADLSLRDGSGLDLCRFIQGHPWCHKTHVLVITGHPSSWIRERAFSAGACEFLPKPFEIDELQGSIRRLLA